MMSFLVANATNSPSVWVKGVITEEGSTGISSGVDHIAARSHCVDLFTEYFGKMPLVVSNAKAIPSGSNFFW